MAHNRVQENSNDMIVKAWQTFLSMFFAFNEVNYARYDSYYTYILVNMEQFYPGLKEMISKEDILIQRQEKYALQTRNDHCGEQAINRIAKNSGKIISIVRSLL